MAKTVWRTSAKRLTPQGLVSQCSAGPWQRGPAFHFKGSMMLRTVTIALALTAATVAPQAYAEVKKPAVATPSDFGCALRMMYMGSKARDALKNSALPEDKRAGADRLIVNSRRAFFYYVGRLGPEFAATNRSDEGKKLFGEMLATPKESLSMEIAVCMTNADMAETDALNALKSPTAK